MNLLGVEFGQGRLRMAEWIIDPIRRANDEGRGQAAPFFCCLRCGPA
jgi:hypothetical protein